MKKSLVAALLAVAAGAALAQQPAAKPAAPAAQQQGPVAGGVAVEIDQWKGTVTKLDVAKRKVTLKGTQGDVHRFTVSKDVKNLDQVKVGDTVTVDYAESVAIELLTPGAQASTGNTSTVTVAPTGRPAMSDVEVQQVQVTVTAVNQAKRTLTVKAPDGSTSSYKVDPSVQNFSQVKVGDKIVVRVTDAMAVTVTK
ncbi:MAG TPA: hypothetical protein VMT93_05680 [Gemmatimonadaceae bacterium]|nr:hypothetical protein [Gemmatimonadaceae bacterium]